MGMTLMMKMTFVLANESSVATSESPNLQTGVTNMHGHHNLHLSALRKGSTACPPIPFNPVTGHSPSHSCLCIS